MLVSDVMQFGCAIPLPSPKGTFRLADRSQEKPVNHWPRLNLMLIALVSLLAAGCVSAPPANPSPEQIAKRFAPPTGMAVIYVYRDTIAGAYYNYPVGLDGQQIAEIPVFTFVEIPVQPGRHRVEIRPPGAVSMGIAIDAEAGRGYFFKHFWFSGTFDAVSEDEGKSAVLGLKAYAEK